MFQMGTAVQIHFIGEISFCLPHLPRLKAHGFQGEDTEHIRESRMNRAHYILRLLLFINQLMWQPSLNPSDFQTQIQYLLLFENSYSRGAF